MSFEDWIFSLHLLMAAMLVGSLVMSWIVVVSLLSAHTPGATLSLDRVGMVGTVTTVVGLVGAIAFGIWLAILRDRVQLWDGWVIAAMFSGASRGGLWRSFAEYGKPAEKARALVAAGETSPNAELSPSTGPRTGFCSAPSRRLRSC